MPRPGVLLGDMVGGMASGEKANVSRPVRNPLKSGTRLVSTMAPAIVIRPDGSPWLAPGTPGGVTIPSTLLQVLVNLIDY